MGLGHTLVVYQSTAAAAGAAARIPAQIARVKGVGLVVKEVSGGFGGVGRGADSTARKDEENPGKNAPMVASVKLGKFFRSPQLIQRGGG